MKIQVVLVLLIFLLSARAFPFFHRKALKQEVVNPTFLETHQVPIEEKKETEQKQKEIDEQNEKQQKIQQKQVKDLEKQILEQEEKAQEEENLIQEMPKTNYTEITDTVQIKLKNEMEDYQILCTQCIFKAMPCDIICKQAEELKVVYKLRLAYNHKEKYSQHLNELSKFLPFNDIPLYIGFYDNQIYIGTNYLQHIKLSVNDVLTNFETYDKNYKGSNDSLFSFPNKVEPKSIFIAFEINEKEISYKQYSFEFKLIEQFKINSQAILNSTKALITNKEITIDGLLSIEAKILLPFVYTKQQGKNQYIEQVSIENKLLDHISLHNFLLSWYGVEMSQDIQEQIQFDQGVKDITHFHLSKLLISFKKKVKQIKMISITLNELPSFSITPEISVENCLPQVYIEKNEITNSTITENSNSTEKKSSKEHKFNVKLYIQCQSKELEQPLFIVNDEKGGKMFTIQINQEINFSSLYEKLFNIPENMIQKKNSNLEDVLLSEMQNIYLWTEWLPVIPQQYKIQFEASLAKTLPGIRFFNYTINIFDVPQISYVISGPCFLKHNEFQAHLSALVTKEVASNEFLTIFSIHMNKLEAGKLFSIVGATPIPKLKQHLFFKDIKPIYGEIFSSTQTIDLNAFTMLNIFKTQQNETIWAKGIQIFYKFSFKSSLSQLTKLIKDQIGSKTSLLLKGDIELNDHSAIALEGKISEKLEFDNLLCHNNRLVLEIYANEKAKVSINSICQITVNKQTVLFQAKIQEINGKLKITGKSQPEQELNIFPQQLVQFLEFNIVVPQPKIQSTNKNETSNVSNSNYKGVSKINSIAIIGKECFSQNEENGYYKFQQNNCIHGSAHIDLEKSNNFFTGFLYNFKTRFLFDNLLELNKYEQAQNVNPLLLSYLFFNNRIGMQYTDQNNTSAFKLNGYCSIFGIKKTKFSINLHKKEKYFTANLILLNKIHFSNNHLIIRTTNESKFQIDLQQPNDEQIFWEASINIFKQWKSTQIAIDNKQFNFELKNVYVFGKQLQFNLEIKGEVQLSFIDQTFQITGQALKTTVQEVEAGINEKWNTWLTGIKNIKAKFLNEETKLNQKIETIESQEGNVTCSYTYQLLDPPQLQCIPSKKKICTKKMKVCLKPGMKCLKKSKICISSEEVCVEFEDIIDGSEASNQCKQKINQCMQWEEVCEEQEYYCQEAYSYICEEEKEVVKNSCPISEVEFENIKVEDEKCQLKKDQLKFEKDSTLELKKVVQMAIYIFESISQKQEQLLTYNQTNRKLIKIYEISFEDELSDQFSQQNINLAIVYQVYPFDLSDGQKLQQIVDEFIVNANSFSSKETFEQKLLKEILQKLTQQETLTHYFNNLNIEEIYEKIYSLALEKINSDKNSTNNQQMNGNQKIDAIDKLIQTKSKGKAKTKAKSKSKNKK